MATILLQLHWHLLCTHWDWNQLHLLLAKQNNHLTHKLTLFLQLWCGKRGKKPLILIHPKHNRPNISNPQCCVQEIGNWKIRQPTSDGLSRDSWLRKSYKLLKESFPRKLLHTVYCVSLLNNLKHPDPATLISHLWNMLQTIIYPLTCSHGNI